MKRILVSGLPRSGTTWISKVLSYHNSVQYIHEPDNERQNLLALIYKDTLNRFPFLAKDDKCPKYKTLFEKAYSGYYLQPYGKISNVIRNVFSLDFDEAEQRIKKNKEYIDYLDHDKIFITSREKLLKASITLASYLKKAGMLMTSNYEVRLVKSVHCLMALEFLKSQLSINHILVIFRHPASIIASHLRMDNKDIWRSILQNNDLLDTSGLKQYKEEVEQLNNTLAKAGARIGAFYYRLQKLYRKSGFYFIQYEDICRNTVDEYKQLYKKLDLHWSVDVRNYIHRLNQKGEGYTVQRIADKQIDKWKNELGDGQIASIKRGYQIFQSELQYQF